MDSVNPMGKYERSENNRERTRVSGQGRFNASFVVSLPADFLMQLRDHHICQF